MADGILSTLHQMLIEERNDLRSLRHHPSQDTVSAMIARMSDAIHMVMQLQDILWAGQTSGQPELAVPLAREGVTQGVVPPSDAAALEASARTGKTEASIPVVKRGRGAPKGEFLTPEADREAYVSYLTYIIDHHFVDGGHMDVYSVKADTTLKTTHFFACLFVLESKQPYTVACPANKSFYDLIHDAVMHSQYASSFTMTYASLNKCIGELQEFQISARGEGKARLLELDYEQRKARHNKWQREMGWMEALRRAWPPVKA